MRPSDVPGLIVGVVHEPSSRLAVCGTESPLVKVTVWPTFAWMSAGPKAKSLIATATCPAALLSAQAAPPPPAAVLGAADAATDGAAADGAAADGAAAEGAAAE